MDTLAMYVQGDIYPAQGNDPSQVVAALTGSKLTTPILGLFHVNCSAETCPNGQSPPGSHDADIAFNDTLVVRDGAYVGEASWPGTIQSLRAGQVSKIFASFGGYGVPDYARIGKLMAKYGTGSDSPLYKNFKCLKDTLGLDGIDFDDEDAYDQDTVVQFAQMLLGMGLEITFCPYGNQSFWSGCIQALGAENVSWLNLQCYAGGKGNNPGDWTGLGVPVVAGVCADCCCEQTNCTAAQVQQVFGVWTTGKGSVSTDCWSGQVNGAVDLAGGFIWTYGEVAAQLDAYVDAMAAGLAAGNEMDIVLDLATSTLTVRNQGARSQVIPLGGANTLQLPNGSAVAPPSGRYWHIASTTGGARVGGTHGPLNMPAGSSATFNADAL